MKRCWLTTIAACLCATALSASAVIAAPAATVERGITRVGGCANGTTATEVGGLKPAKNDQHTNRGKHLGQGKPDKVTETDDADSDEADGDHERKQNHGWFVSQVAKDHSVTGRAHGEAVSQVARSDQGKPDAADH